MMHRHINENLYDADYVSKYTLGFDELEEKRFRISPGEGRRLHRDLRSRHRELAREYATTHPAAIRVNYGFSARRTVHGMRASPCSLQSPALGKISARHPAFHQRRSQAQRGCTHPCRLMKKSHAGRQTRVINMSSSRLP